MWELRMHRNSTGLVLSFHMDLGKRFGRLLPGQTHEKIDLPGCRNEVTRCHVTYFRDPEYPSGSKRREVYLSG